MVLLLILFEFYSGKSIENMLDLLTPLQQSLLESSKNRTWAFTKTTARVVLPVITVNAPMKSANELSAQAHLSSLFADSLFSQTRCKLCALLPNVSCERVGFYGQCYLCELCVIHLNVCI